MSRYYYSALCSNIALIFKIKVMPILQWVNDICGNTIRYSSEGGTLKHSLGFHMYLILSVYETCC